MRDYYRILNTTFGASESEIKKQFRELAKRYHPDKNQNSKISEDKFKDILNAYETLKDKEKRAIYDRSYGHYNRYSKSDDLNNSYNSQETNKNKSERYSEEHNNKSVIPKKKYGFWIIVILFFLYYILNNKNSNSEKYIIANPTIEEQNTEIRPQSGELDFN